MLCTLKEVLQQAQREQRAIGSFNVYNMETIHGVVQAAKEKNVPAIVSFGASYLKNMTLEEVAVSVRRLTQTEELPFVLHLDHCKDRAVIRQAIDAGFTSVMYDGSALPFTQNVENTKAVCQMAHEKNVSVEAELGSLALGDYSNETDIDHGQQYTDPKSARVFVEETGVDALAVSIGTVHGMYRGTPNIRVDLLAEIKQQVSVPLVLHGGSGTPEDVIGQCIQNGICKINVNTELSQYTMAKTREHLQQEPNTHFSQLSLLQRTWVKEIVGNYMTLFYGATMRS